MTFNALARITLLFLTICATVGCASESGTGLSHQAGSGTSLPGWAQNINEPVDLIPMDAQPDRVVLTTPTGMGNQSHGRLRGTPKDLTQPITIAASSSLAGAGTQGHNPSQTDSRNQLTININAGNDAGDDTVQPSIEEEASAPLERLYLGRYDRNADRHMKQFGYDYFKNQHRGNSVGPVPDSYIIGPGDDIVITVSGSFNAYHQLTVDRQGRITLPDIGPVAVAQRSFAELNEVVTRAYAQTRKEFEVTTALGRMRTVQVHVVGEVNGPGLIEVSAQATILGALSAAGGPKKTGSLRQIELRRHGVSTEVIDLYRFFVSGERASDTILQAGDVIHVPAIGPTIGVAGYVQRPGIYELRGGLTIGEAMTQAGGLTPFTFTPHVQVEQTVDGRGRQTMDVDLNEAGRNRAMYDGELLLIGAVDDRLQPVVQITGEVLRPGQYQYRSDLRVSDLIDLADGLTVDAYLPQAFISRQVGEAGALEMVPDRMTVGSTRRVIVIDLAKALEGEDDQNQLLLPLDHITIRSRTQSTIRPTVEIKGAVKSPGTFELTTGLRVSELLALAGNLTPNAYFDEAELIRRIHNDDTGQLDVVRYRFDLKRALTEGGQYDPVLDNGDRLVIRKMRQAEVTARIDGQVRFPGEYVFPAGAKITDLIAAAGGISPGADLRAASFTRKSVQRLQRDRFGHLTERTQRIFENALREMVQTGAAREGVAAKLALQDVEQMMERMTHSESTGRIVIPFVNRDFPDSEYNLAIEDGDRLVIPRRQETVAVIGSVFTPNSFVAAEGLSVADALDRAGGPTEYADKDQVYVLRADGNVESLAQLGNNRLSMSARLLPGDVVLVPRSAPERTTGAKIADTVALLRRVAETSVIADQIGRTASDFNLSTISSPANNGNGINAYQEAVLERTKR